MHNAGIAHLRAIKLKRFHGSAKEFLHYHWETLKNYFSEIFADFPSIIRIYIPAFKGTELNFPATFAD